MCSDEIPHDFDMKLEVYCHKLHEEFSVSNTPKKLRKKINDISGSVGRSVGKRLSGLVRICEVFNQEFKFLLEVIMKKIIVIALFTINIVHVEACIHSAFGKSGTIIKSTFFFCFVFF